MKQEKLNAYERKKVKELYVRLKNGERLADELSKDMFSKAELMNEELEKIIKSLKLKTVLTDKQADEVLNKLDTLTIKKLKKLLRSMNYQNHDLFLRKKKIEEIEDDEGLFFLDYYFYLMFSDCDNEIRDYLFGVIDETYSQGMKDLNFSGNLNRKTIEKMVNSKWNKLNWRDRQKNNVFNTRDKIKRNAYKAILTGNVNERIKEENILFMAQLANKTKSLIRTEAAEQSNETEAMAAVDCGFDKYLYLSIGDDKTCEWCLNLDGGIFSYSMRRIGENYPPLHPNCRCIAIPMRKND